MRLQKLLTIIIPQHSENELGIFKLLSSINNQVGIDFSTVNIMIIGDGGYQLKTSFFKHFNNLDIEYIYYKNAHGPGYARQYGLERTHSKYLAYMDADDVLNTVNALWKFVNLIKNTGDHQVIFSRYIEEHQSDEKGENSYTVREFNPSAAYGKWINVQYIREHKFCWHPELKRAYEDTFFLDLIITFADDIYYLDSPTYTWLYHSGSIVRSMTDYNKACLDQYVRENRFWAQEISRRAPQRLFFDINNGLTNIYNFYVLHPPLKEIKNKFLREVKLYLTENIADINLSYAVQLLKKNYPQENEQGFTEFWTKQLRGLSDNIWSTKVPKIEKDLTIVVPFGGTRLNELYNLMSSIDFQINFDLQRLEVMIVNDGGPITEAAELQKYFPKLDIHWINQSERSGPGPARSSGLKAAQGKYVMFCDADDQLHTVDSLYLMQLEVQREPAAQIIMAKYVNEQLDNDGKRVLAEWNYNFGAVYPSWFRIDFLRSYAIDFHPKIHSYYEDTFFCGLAFRVARRTVFSERKIYTHCLNPNSLIHKKIELKQREFLIEYCKENYYWFKEAKQRFPEQVSADLNNFAIDLYYMYTSYAISTATLEAELKEITHKIVKENTIYWHGWNSDLQKAADNKGEGDAKRISSSGLNEFIKTFMQPEEVSEF
ncbi:hypothetical protein JCM15457_2051 [Liquorilactobacillus sucicola DSM 21376 = JCM 15457]|uniref:Glycosyltransferase 2-like domain-containing protein n=1 Tax=Liquorilactobacillus sucicola DSM 21376 = JCM 15457 TaxID=1423806 RepID=A0A023CZ41_9LACO|nr:glycosyltransferase [Liquorilactobacillus sucicola]KRN06653.1 hypothetical protein FD15_GL000203 [Liquorilactobacillus sucicola DSM 21376 = JCM 15457]GAJ27089.1 hypothetical protein JCM15457_2051 [Liquorilactobacillus sucicola DSM 21376 = JCM 15457]